MGKGKGSLLGGIAGAAFGPIGLAGGALLGGSLFGGNAADNLASSAGAAANAQLRNAQQNYANVSRIGGAASVAALASQDKAVQAQERSLARSEEMLKNIDPTILEASQQALRLLRGESSSTLAPIQKQRDLQRQKLLSSLREQLGPGAETSTAGIQALTRFDSETNSLLAGQQQNALQSLGQTFGTFSSYAPKIGAEAQTLSGLAADRAGTQFNYANLLNNANANVYSSAGAPYTGGVIRAQGQMAQQQQLGNLGGMLLGRAIGV